MPQCLTPAVAVKNSGWCGNTVDFRYLFERGRIIDSHHIPVPISHVNEFAVCRKFRMQGALSFFNDPDHIEW